LPERIFNLLFGLSVLSWAYFGLTQTNPESADTSVRYAITALNIVVGLLIIFRRTSLRNARLKEIWPCLPSLMAAGLAMKMAPPFYEWPQSISLLFVVATGWTILSFMFLGRNFAILPGLRGVTKAGPYNCLRHPAS
jgi:protein-S-isoprenylcysteine O-methyltransferase Ste14